MELMEEILQDWYLANEVHSDALESSDDDDYTSTHSQRNPTSLTPGRVKRPHAGEQNERAAVEPVRKTRRQTTNDRSHN